jgi:hypothetical protein
VIVTNRVIYVRLSMVYLPESFWFAWYERVPMSNSNLKSAAKILIDRGCYVALESFVKPHLHISTTKEIRNCIGPNPHTTLTVKVCLSARTDAIVTVRKWLQGSLVSRDQTIKKSIDKLIYDRITSLWWRPLYVKRVFRGGIYIKYVYIHHKKFWSCPWLGYLM